MDFLRVLLSIFAILNVVFWALLAWVWAVKPAWAARIPLNLGTDKRYATSVPVWGRLAAAVAAFWAVAAVLYLTVDPPNRPGVLAPFVMGPIFLLLWVVPAPPGYNVLQLPKNSLKGPL